MKHPRDDNLRLIGADEEAAHILDRYLAARDLVLLFSVAAVAAAGVLAYVAHAAEELSLFWMATGFAAATATATSVVFAIFHAAKLVKYRLYRRNHERFLRNYNRL